LRSVKKPCSDGWLDFFSRDYQGILGNSWQRNYLRLEKVKSLLARIPGKKSEEISSKLTKKEIRLLADISRV